MRVPLRWLEEWVDVPVSPKELAEQLTMSGLEVDSIERSGPDLSEIRVGRVEEREPHPNADRLSLCRVDLGEGELRPIVCGAPNVAAGQLVAVAIPGTTLPDGTRLKKSKIRGEVSLGMICSASELGLSDEHEGILVLDEGATLGAPLDEVVRAGDVVLEVAILANRGDCTSMIGMAREVRAHYGGALRIPACEPPEGKRRTAEDIAVEISDPAGGHVYVARVVRGVRVEASPAWLQEKLEAVGLRPINNVVDITNLVMLEFGQPLHAFDLGKLRGGVVAVRRAEDGEGFQTLDGEERKLEASDLVIADAERAIALAGIMGGADTEVSEATTDVLIESANFDAKRIRRTARRLGLSTDASYRFERRVDRGGVQRAADRAARLLAELAGGEVSQGIVEVRGDEPAAVEQVALSPARLNRVLGTELTAETIVAYLERLGIEKGAEDGGELILRIPSHRNDLELPEDLIEEVARIHGFDEIEPHAQREVLQGGRVPPAWDLAARCSDVLVGAGLTEVQSFPFMNPGDLDWLDLAPDDPRRQTLGIRNPIVDSDSRMRSSLVPALLRLTRQNLHHQATEVRLFEIARVFRLLEAGALPDEKLRLTAVLTRATEKALWDEGEARPMFFFAKGVAERLVAASRVGLSFEPGGKEPYLHPGAACEIWAGKRVVGVVGELHPACAVRFEIEVPCAVLELDLSALAEMPTQNLKYREVSRFPLMRRDLAVLLDRDQRAGEVLEAIRQKAGAHLTGVEIFDRYEGAGVPESKISVAFRLTYQRTDRTLTDAEVTKATDRVVQMLARRFGGELR